MFQTLAHPVRLQILKELAHQPACVCELVMLIGRRQAYISQHLALLRGVELVRAERTGSSVLYRVNAARLVDVFQVLRSFLPLANSDYAAHTLEAIEQFLPRPEGANG